MKNDGDKTLRVSEKTYEDLHELKYKTRTPIRTLAEEAVKDLKTKRLKKGKSNDKGKAALPIKKT